MLIWGIAEDWANWMAALRGERVTNNQTHKLSSYSVVVQFEVAIISTALGNFYG